MKQAMQSITAGLGRTVRSPKLVLGLWLLNVLAALPAALVMSEVLEDSIGPSLFHQTMTEGFDSDWHAEFAAETEGLASTFGPDVIGIAAVYQNLEAWWSGRLVTDFPTGLVCLGIAYALLWTLLLGGILATLSPSGTEAPGVAGFLTSGGRTFTRFFQLAITAGVAYFLIYRLARKLFEWIETSTRDVTVEGAVFLRVLLVAVFAVLLLHLVRMIFDYAKIAVFADDVSALRAVGRALAFVASRPVSALAIYGGLGGLVLAAVAVYAWTAPGAGQSSVFLVVLAFLLSQLYLVARLTLRLGLLASELDFYGTSSSD